MGTLAQWEGYVRALEPLARWNVPDTVQGRDLLERIRRKNDAQAMLQQSTALLRQAWQAFPAEMRASVLDALTSATDQALKNIGAVTDAVPVIGNMVGLYVQAISGFVRAGKGVKKENRKISNFAHQRGHFMTIASLKDPWMWVYTPAVSKVYAQFIKVRVGGDWDVVPAFTRAGLERDRPFTGVNSPPDSGNCRKEIRIGLNYVWDPASNCRRTLGLSALFYPWWSGAYAARPLPIWDPDTVTNANRLLMARQSELITDPATNLRVPMARVVEVRDRLLKYYRIDRELYPIDKEGNVAGARGPRIDARRNARHVPSITAESRWYVDDVDMIQPYPDQPGAEIDRWGWPAPAGKPSNLGVTIAQRNNVVAMSAAFAARRQSTIRNGLLSAAMLEDYNPNAFDPAAVPALEYAASQRRTLPAIGGPTVKPMIAKIPAGALRPKDEGDGLGAAAAMAALLFL